MRHEIPDAGRAFIAERVDIDRLRGGRTQVPNHAARGTEPEQSRRTKAKRAPRARPRSPLRAPFATTLSS